MPHKRHAGAVMSINENQPEQNPEEDAVDASVAGTEGELHSTVINPGMGTEEPYPPERAGAQGMHGEQLWEGEGPGAEEQLEEQVERLAPRIRSYLQQRPVPTFVGLICFAAVVGYFIGRVRK